MGDEPHANRRGAFLLPTLLSTTAGAVDVIAFLALGVFTAHITGNLVILAGHYVTGRFGEIGPILSVPVFMLVLGVVTLTFVALPMRVARRSLLVLQLILLAAFLGFGVGFGPFPNIDSPMAVFVAMLGVAAMATQNAVVRLALHGSPSTAVMTTNTAQFAVDVARLIRNRDQNVDLSRVRRRAALTFASILGFVIGLVFGAVLEFHFGLWSLTLPALLSALAIPLGEFWPASSDTASHSDVQS
jgi:uncharacterized membrane protein YoaK (UPF0700 family)